MSDEPSNCSHSRNCEQTLPPGGGKDDGTPSKLLRRNPWTHGAAGSGFMLSSYVAAALTLSALVFLTLRVGAECSDRSQTQLVCMPPADDLHSAPLDNANGNSAAPCTSSTTRMHVPITDWQISCMRCCPLPACI